MNIHEGEREERTLRFMCWVLLLFFLLRFFYKNHTWDHNNSQRASSKNRHSVLLAQWYCGIEPFSEWEMKLWSRTKSIKILDDVYFGVANICVRDRGIWWVCLLFVSSSFYRRVRWFFSNEYRQATQKSSSNVSLFCSSCCWGGVGHCFGLVFVVNITWVFSMFLFFRWHTQIDIFNLVFTLGLDSRRCDKLIA